MKAIASSFVTGISAFSPGFNILLIVLQIIQLFPILIDFHLEFSLVRCLLTHFSNLEAFVVIQTSLTYI